MTQKKHTRHRHRHHKLRLFLAVLAIVTAALALVREKDLPAALQGKPQVTAFFEQRQVLLEKITPVATTLPVIEKVTGAKAGQGYSDKDREKMDQLITQDAVPAGKAVSGAARDH